jgi:hypothetical protein
MLGAGPGDPAVARDLAQPFVVRTISGKVIGVSLCAKSSVAKEAGNSGESAWADLLQPGRRHAAKGWHHLMVRLASWPFRNRAA